MRIIRNSVLIIASIFVLSDAVAQSDSKAPGELRKVYTKDPAEVQRFKDGGAEIIVRQPDYVVLRFTETVSRLTVESEPIRERDLVQRVARIQLRKPGDLQRAVDIGIDLWRIQDGTAVARVFDIHIERLEQAGLKVEVLAQDASNFGKEESK